MIAPSIIACLAWLLIGGALGFNHHAERCEGPEVMCRVSPFAALARTEGAAEVKREQLRRGAVNGVEQGIGMLFDIIDAPWNAALLLGLKDYLQPTINGQVPPGVASAADGGEVSTYWYGPKVQADGLSHAVIHINRSHGFRTPVHIHFAPFISCVLAGARTFYLEGREPAVQRAPSCDIIPAGRKMANAADIAGMGYEGLDYFVQRSDVSYWFPLESEGWEEFTQVRKCSGDFCGSLRH